MTANSSIVRSAEDTGRDRGSPTSRGAKPVTALAPRSSFSRSLGGWLGEIIARRDLLYMLVWRETVVKYKQSVMGFMWAVLMPALIVGAGIIVKYAFASLSGKPLQNSDVIGVAVRSVPWAFFVASIRFASTSLISNANLVTKIYMPRVIFPIAAVLAQLIDFLVSSIVLVIFLIAAGAHLSAQLLWLPLLFFTMVVLVTGIAVFISAAGLFLRDVKYIVEVLLTFAIFFTPVFYDASMLGRWAKLMMLNPVAPLLEGISAAVLGLPGPAPEWLAYSAFISIAAFAGALIFFKRTEPYFAESV